MLTRTRILLLLGAALVALAVPNFQAARERANMRACFANQKTYAGAVEMYGLDFGEKLDELDDATLVNLRTNGYMCHTPSDPGFGYGSEFHYVLSDASPTGILCLVHGPYDTGGIPMREPRKDSWLGSADRGRVADWLEKAGAAERHVRRARYLARNLGNYPGVDYPRRSTPYRRPESSTSQRR